MPERPRILVIGGASGMGRWMAQRAFAGCDVTVADLSPNTPSQAATIGAQGIVAEYTEGRLTTPDPATFDVVLLAVPVPVMPTVAASVAPWMRAGALLTDVASVKGPVVQAMLRHAPADVSVVSLHPLFGPAVRDAAGQHVAVIVPPGRCDPAWETWLHDLLVRQRTVLVTTTPEEHDATVAVTQALAHFASLSLARTLQSLHKDPRVPFDLGRAWAFKTPVYEALIAVAGRILAGEPGLYAAIQLECAVPAVRERFLEESQRLLDAVRRGTNASLTQEIADIGSAFERSNYERAMYVSQALVAALGRERQQLLDSVGKLVALEHADTPGTVHMGILRHVDLVAGVVDVEERMHRDADGRYVVVHDDESAAAAARLGVRPSMERVRLGLGRFRLLTPDQLRAWRRANLRRHALDVSVHLPPAADAAHVANILPTLVDDVVAATVKDTFEREGQRRATFTIEAVGDREPKAVLARIRAALTPLGFRA